MLSPGQQAHFRERGYVVVRGAVEASRVAAANDAIDALLRAEPPEPGHHGPHFLFPSFTDTPALGALWLDPPVRALAESLIGAGEIEELGGLQVALTYPPHEPPLGPHIDGHVLEPDGRPGTFTMLCGVVLSDQSRPSTGNFMVWPGSHETYAAYFRDHGADAYLAHGGYPPVDLTGPPEPVLASPGDVLLAHHLLGHTVGPNTSDVVRRSVYFRLFRNGHRVRWREAMADPWLEYDGLRS